MPGSLMINSSGRASCRILICEDNSLIALELAVILTKAGYRVVGPAYTAEKALELAYQDLPDLALINIGLCGPIDGISVAAELAPLGTAVIFITADYQRAAVEGRIWAVDILIKPVMKTTILRSVASAYSDLLENTRGDATRKSAS
jgi:two-component SAPR family response regulator